VTTDPNRIGKHVPTGIRDESRAFGLDATAAIAAAVAAAEAAESERRGAAARTPGRGVLMALPDRRDPRQAPKKGDGYNRPADPGPVTPTYADPVVATEYVPKLARSLTGSGLGRFTSPASTISPETDDVVVVRASSRRSLFSRLFSRS
jgi:hypothetical protein